MLIIVFMSVISFNIFCTSDGIHPYNEKYSAAVRKIAIDNIGHLVNLRRGEKEEDAFNHCIKPVFTSKHDTTFHISNVYIVQQQPIGFITYGTFYPRRWYPEQEVLPYGEIHHLAIAKDYQGKGYGKALLHYAIQDCKNKGATGIRLKTTNRVGKRSTETFYKSQGFWTGYDTPTCYRWVLHFPDASRPRVDSLTTIAKLYARAAIRLLARK